MATRQSQRASEQELHAIIENPESQEFAALRDRAAYVRCTGTFPTHLRSFMSSLLNLATSYHHDRKVALDGRSGSMELTPEVMSALDLDSHPMVARVSDFVGQGYKIFFQRELTERRPFSKVLLYKTEGDDRSHRITVQSDGSMLDGWGALA